MKNNFNNLKKFWNNKKVFLTGHTGFKGSWFSILLNMLGAKVVGYSLRPEKKKNLFDLASLDKVIHNSIIGDIRNYSKLKKSILKFKPHEQNKKKEIRYSKKRDFNEKVADEFL